MELEDCANAQLCVKKWRVICSNIGSRGDGAESSYVFPIFVVMKLAAEDNFFWKYS